MRIMQWKKACGKKAKKKGLGQIGAWLGGAEVGKGGDGQDGPNLQGIHFQGLARDVHGGNYNHHAKDGNDIRQG